MAAVAAGAKDEEGAMGDVFYTYTTSTKRRAWRVEVVDLPDPPKTRGH